MKNEKEFIRYIIWGLITTLFHFLFYYLLNIIGLYYVIANVIAIITTKALAYICNKLFVFKSKCDNYKELLKEIFHFIISRGFTFLIDFFGLILLVDIIHIDKIISKIIILIIVVIINYILGKKYVYKKTRS